MLLVLSSLFLKKLVGAGYTATFVTDQTCDRDKLTVRAFDCYLNGTHR